jgi:hypothetical protein
MANKMVKVKLSPYKPGETPRVPGGSGSQISRKSTYECGYQPYAPAAFTPREYSWYSFLLEAESPPRHITTGKIRSMKNSNDM